MELSRNLNVMVTKIWKWRESKIGWNGIRLVGRMESKFWWNGITTWVEWNWNLAGMEPNFGWNGIARNNKIGEIESKSEWYGVKLVQGMERTSRCFWSEIFVVLNLIR